MCVVPFLYVCVSRCPHPSPIHQATTPPPLLFPQYTPAAYTADNDAACTSIYVTLNGVIAACYYVEVSTDMYKCKAQNPPNYPCTDA